MSNNIYKFLIYSIYQIFAGSKVATVATVTTVSLSSFLLLLQSKKYIKIETSKPSKESALNPKETFLKPKYFVSSPYLSKNDPTKIGNIV